MNKYLIVIWFNRYRKGRCNVESAESAAYRDLHCFSWGEGYNSWESENIIISFPFNK